MQGPRVTVVQEAGQFLPQSVPVYPPLASEIAIIQEGTANGPRRSIAIIAEGGSTSLPCARYAIVVTGVAKVSCHELGGISATVVRL